MSTEAPFKFQQKKPNVPCWCCCLLILAPFLIFFQPSDPGTKIVVSRQTTFITEPLKRDGLPDYEKFALKLYRDGVKPENNAAVLLWQAMWPGQLEPADYEPFCRELALPKVPSADTALKRLYGDDNQQRILKWLQENSQSNATPDNVKILLDNALTRPWKAEAFPPLANWVRENRSAIDIIVAASQRSQYYSPSPSLLNDVHEPFLEALLPGLVMARDAGRALAIRAMANLGEGHIEEAWQDILAIHRLAGFVAQDSTLTEQAVAMQIRRISCDATIALLSQNNIPVDKLRQFQRDLYGLPEFSGLANSLDTFERVMYLDFVLWFRAGHAEALGELLDAVNAINRIVKATRLPADWNIVLQRGNELFDRMVVAARMPPGELRDTAVSKINADLDRMKKDVHNRIKSIANMNQQERGELYAEITIGLFITDVQADLNIQDGANTLLQLTRLVAALAVYRADHRVYPENLEELIPGVISALPTDLSNGKPFIYQRDGDGFLIYSSGPDHVDDKGSNEKLGIFQGHLLNDLPEVESQKLLPMIHAGTDDISIRGPRPPLKLQKPGPTE